MGVLNKRRRAWPGATLVALLLMTTAASAQDLLVRNATVHTASARGSLQNADVLVQGGVIRAVGNGLSAPAGATVVEANGRPLTPALFGGITETGIEEVSGESSTVDSSLKIGEQPLRPEFDVTLAYNPASVLIPVTRLEGIGFTALGAATGGGFVAGQGGVMRLDGSIDPIGPRALFLRIGAAASELTGHSRAAQWMLLQQMIDEARGQVAADSPHALLTPAGRRTLSRYLAGQGRIVVEVDRAADIRQLLRWAAREKVKIAISGASEAWQVAPELAAAHVPVFVDVLSNLPASFDQIGATLENAARLQRAGVAVSFVQRGDASHNARKMRQLAGNAVANGLPWADGLAGLTRVPAQAFGVADQIGSIEPGKRADLVLWEGDPLDVAHYARAGLAGWSCNADALTADRTARPLPAAQRAALTAHEDTPMATLRWYFDFISPYSYLHWQKLKQLPQFAQIQTVPIAFGAVLHHLGNLDLRRFRPSGASSTASCCGPRRPRARRCASRRVIRSTRCPPCACAWPPAPARRRWTCCSTGSGATAMPPTAPRRCASPAPGWASMMSPRPSPNRRSRSSCGAIPRPRSAPACSVCRPWPSTGNCSGATTPTR